MTDENISLIIDQTLDELAEGIEAQDLNDIDGVELSDGKLVIEFEDGVILIVSRQAAADQIWVAEPGGGWHFDYRDGEWICNKRKIELKQSLQKLIGEKTGVSINLLK